MTADATLHVAVGVVVNSSGEVLISRRHDHLHQGGLWEFPGGKVEPGETVAQALSRELHEELAISIERTEPLITVRHAYPDRRVKLDVLRVEQFSGDAKGQLGQPIRWVPPDLLHEYAFPAANRAIVTAAKLPDRLGIVDVPLDNPETAFAQLDAFHASGIKLVRLRGKSVAHDQYLRLAGVAVASCRSRQMAILLDGDPSRAVALGAKGVHFTSSQLSRITEFPFADGLLVSASCHDLKELKQAESLGADFATLSPVLPTESHPGVGGLGWNAFADLVNQVNIPVYALGGMCAEHRQMAKYLGAQGIAGIRRLTGS